MEEKHNDATQQRLERNRPVDGDLVTIDLPMFKKQIKGESPWKSGKLNAITVFKTNGLRIVLIGFSEGVEMTRHIADGIISVQVLEGQMQFNTDGKSVELCEGQMLALHESIPHSMLAVKETIFLLTLTSALE
jgi:quercetin dioxygenase-like cupin family protein